MAYRKFQEDMDAQNINEQVRAYYEDKLIRFGATYRGVDWNSEASQSLRLRVLLRGLGVDMLDSFSVLDYGCGYGALVEVANTISPNFSYTGFDVSSAMIEVARQRFRDVGSTIAFTTELPDTTFDYTIASGVFNVKGETNDADWEEYVFHCVDQMSKAAGIGFGFNMLTLYSDPDRRQSHLYYADPLRVFDLCRRRYSSKVSLIHDYELYEFTIVVKR